MLNKKNIFWACFQLNMLTHCKETSAKFGTFSIKSLFAYKLNEIIIHGCCHTFPTNILLSNISKRKVNVLLKEKKQSFKFQKI